MANIQELADIKATLIHLREEIRQQKDHNRSLQLKLEIVKASQDVFQTITTTESLKPEVPSYIRAEDINLQVFMAIPTFNGNAQDYRPWRSMVHSLMSGIEKFTGTPQYYHALTIIRTKVQGEAAHILTNQNTIMNFKAIINRLDYTYADSRPLYVLQEELRRIHQGRNSLSEYYDKINNALNLILSKITMTSSDEGRNIQEKLAMEEAIRIFTANLNSSFTKATLYSNQPSTLERAYAIALTIQHDNMSENLSHNKREIAHNVPKPQPNIQHMNMQQQYDNRQFRPNIQTQRQQYVTPNHPRAMETNNSMHNRRNPFRQNEYQQNYNRQQHSGYQHQQNNNQQAVKRDREGSDRNHKVQRVNQSNTQKFNEEVVSNDHLDISYESESIFLGV